MPGISAMILGLSLACGCSKTAPDTVPPDRDEQPMGPEIADQRPMRVTGVYLDPALAAVCELEDRHALVEFDGGSRSEEVTSTLAAVSTCVKSGPLKGRRVEVVGHAAKEDEFTKTYGKSRAEELRAVLVQDGIPEADIVTHTADPEDDKDAAREWPSERRVDLRVATRHAGDEGLKPADEAAR